MPSYRELLQQVKGEVEQVDAREAEAIDGAAWVDVRRHDDPESTLPGALRIPPDEIPARLGELPRGAPIVLVCT